MLKLKAEPNHFALKANRKLKDLKEMQEENNAKLNVKDKHDFNYNITET